MKLRNKKQIFGIITIVFTLSACGKTSPSVEPISTLEQEKLFTTDQSKIIGENNLIKVKVDGSNIDSNLRPYLNAFGIIDIGGKGTCSGTHIGGGYVITAGHCMFPEGQEGIIADKDCDGFRVFWGYRGSPNTGSAKPYVSLISKCTKVVYAELSEVRDVAIFKIDQAPSISVPISITKVAAQTGTKLTIFGYPQGRPLEWSQYCSVVNIQKVPTKFAHACDTEPGNSGSTVLAINSAGKPFVVGIHDASIPNQEFNLATHFNAAVIAIKARTKVDLIQVIQSYN